MATWIRADVKVPDEYGKVHWRDAQTKLPITSGGAFMSIDRGKAFLVEWYDEAPVSIPEDVKNKVRTAAQNRYGDKTTNEHHEQACFIAGGEFVYNLLAGHNQSIPPSVVEALIDNNPYESGEDINGAYYAGWENCVSKLRELLQKDLTSKTV